MLTVLVADDEPAVLRRVEAIVDWEALGYTIVATARDGEDALEAIKRLRPDLVITDIRMPVIDGLGLIEAMKELGVHSSVILLTGYGEFSYAKRAIQLGAVDYLLKPLDADALTSALARVRKASTEADRTLARERWAARVALSRSGEEGPSAADLGFGEHTFECIAIRSTVLMDSDLVESALSDAFPDAADADRVAVRLPSRDSADFFLIALRRTAGSEPVARATLARLRSIGDRSAIVAHSGRANREATIPRAIAEARTALETGYLLGQDRVIGMDAVKTEYDEPAIRLRVRELALACAGAIAGLDLDAAVRLVDSAGSAIRDNGAPANAARRLVAAFELALEHALASASGPRTSDDRTLDEAIDRLRDFVTRLVEQRGERYGARTERVSDFVLRYLREHYVEEIRVQDLATIANLNPAYLGQRFRQETGKSVHDALLEIRMRVASQLLAESDAPVNSIATRVGYHTPVHFYRGFRRVFGITPNEYRQRPVPPLEEQ